MRTIAAGAALLAAGLALTAPHPAAAQGVVLNGGATIGARAFDSMPGAQQKGKFLQYRDMPSGFLFQSLYFRMTTRDSFQSLQLFGSNLGQQDQNSSLRLNHPGMADLQVRWDRTPHVFSTTSRFLGTESAPGVYTLPTPRPDTATLNHSPYVGAVKERWDPVRVTLAVTPTTNWDFKADFEHIDKNGYRPMGMAFGGSSNNAREINEPIDQAMSDIRLSQNYSQKNYQLGVSYAYSKFTNAFQSVTSDNPLSTTDSFKLGSSRGRTALAPDNTAQTLTAFGAATLPRHTRVTGTLSFGWRDQNQAFIPATINSKDQDSLTRAGYVFPTSLNGSIHTTLANVTLTSRPIKRVTLTGRYRYYDFRDNTPEVSVPILVISDRTFAAGASSERFPYSKSTADFGFSARPLVSVPINISAGLGLDRMIRDSAVRNVTRVKENTARISADYTGLAWASLHASYSHADRWGNEYHRLTTSENPEARRFDEANRTRNRMVFMATVTPIDQVSLMGTWEIGRDTFPDSPFGVQCDKSNAIGGEIDWSPISRVSIGGGYLREWYDNQFRGRYRTGSTGFTLNNPTWDWVATNIDTSTTVYISATGTVIPNRLEAGGTWQRTKSSFQLQAVNPLTPTGGTAAQNLAATAMSFPTATQSLEPLSIFLRYRLNADWSVAARYQTETFTNYDFRTTGLSPATGIQVFQGNDLLPYDAKFFTFSMSFRPGLLRTLRSAM